VIIFVQTMAKIQSVPLESSRARVLIIMTNSETKMILPPAGIRWLRVDS
jgi:hypothetical protein